MLGEKREASAVLKEFLRDCREQWTAMVSSIKSYESGDLREMRSEDGQVETTSDWVANLKDRVARLGKIITAGERDV
jgi:hypothetical protein